MPDQPVENLPPHDRRRFFAAGLARVLAPLAAYLEQRLPLKLPALTGYLRPPGALPEQRFLDTCYRCGSCADACPVQAIKLMRIEDEDLAGTPQIDPDERACVLCDDLSCMKACPSGALRFVEKLDIRIGLARVNQKLCLRPKGEDCTACVERCPLGQTAIVLDSAGRVRVIDPAPTGRGCTGCGLCQQFCPVLPVAAVRVLPY